ncbi:hypothetical protein [Brachyspira hampsonii]|uniref:Uncharacterized protein n=1 Tax=Brachyspira hampsonii TaxID=1287055 RepID=A0AAC9XKY0_9SPIR|nr:hypothetical protein [Brachyspira hampsonii]ASJ21941.1 hypothetical protein BHAMNSH16_09990 [Brachyspira hampsonii]ELV05854.1 hypothetical protein H263_07733 [Brachyspira hampsonii 30599]MBW5380354.1 hypothetical protein [Brachyspira hampsonii]OEJ19506.1 hypothetical protein A9496_03695 [Brachyspira hampsonii]
MSNKERIIKTIKIIAYLFSYMMVTVVAFNYGYMFYAVKFDGASAPPSVSFIFAIPFIAAIFLCAIIIKIIKRRMKD